MSPAGGRAVVWRAARLVAMAAGFLAAAAPAAAQHQPPGGDAVFERHVVDVSPARGVTIDLVDISNVLGSVRVEGHDQAALTIVAHKRAPDRGTLDRLKVSLVPDPRGPVQIATALLPAAEARPVGAGTVRIDLVVRAPRNARVRAQVWKGTVELEAMDNGGELTTNEGDIAVRNVAGTISTHSTRGRQRFASVFGAVDAQGLYGEMQLELIEGARLMAMLYEGRIVARQIRSRTVSLLTTRGDIVLEASPVRPARYSVASLTGDIFVRVSGPVSVRARSRDGQVVLPAVLQPRRAGGAQHGERGPEAQRTGVVLRSRHGDIRFVLAE
jgi:hypothetical protein